MIGGFKHGTTSLSLSRSLTHTQQQLLISFTHFQAFSSSVSLSFFSCVSQSFYHLFLSLSLFFLTILLIEVLRSVGYLCKKKRVLDYVFISLSDTYCVFIIFAWTFAGETSRLSWTWPCCTNLTHTSWTNSKNWPFTCSISFAANICSSTRLNGRLRAEGFSCLHHLITICKKRHWIFYEGQKCADYQTAVVLIPCLSDIYILQRVLPTYQG